MPRRDARRRDLMPCRDARRREPMPRLDARREGPTTYIPDKTGARGRRDRQRGQRRRPRLLPAGVQVCRQPHPPRRGPAPARGVRRGHGGARLAARGRHAAHPHARLPPAVRPRAARDGPDAGRPRRRADAHGRGAARGGVLQLPGGREERGHPVGGLPVHLDGPLRLPAARGGDARAADDGRLARLERRRARRGDLRRLYGRGRDHLPGARAGAAAGKCNLV
mmetsp:Transcript_5164/g.15328  ORF Transcript_5164/g.15328 Transcript_5164/m.15328 type:complete len:223 (-) Transcript_5164:12-680(-)